MPRERGDTDTLFERLFFAVLLAILVFAPLATGAVRAVDFLVVQGATIVLLLLWAARVWFSPGTRLLWPPVAWVVVAFCGYAVARYFTADIEYVARLEVIRVLVYGAVFLAAMNNVTRRETVQWLGIALVVVAAGIAAYAVYQWGAKSDHVWGFVRPGTYAGRGSGTFICPNHLAGFLEILLPLGLAYSIAGRGGFLVRLLVGYAALMAAAGIVVSLSRAGWVAAGAGLLLFFVLQIQNRRYRVPALAMLALLAAVGLVAVQRSEIVERRGMDERVFTDQYGSGAVRAQIWQAAFTMWRGHPWTGVGPAHFDHRFPQYRLPTRSVQGRPDRAHNDYLNTLADWGLAGFALVAVAWALVLVSVARVWKYIQRPVGDLARNNHSGSPGQSNRTAFVTGAVAGLAALLLHSLFDFNMHIPANALLAVTLLALLAGHIRFATERWWCSGATTRLGVTLLALVLGVALGVTGLRRAVETKWLRRAEQAEPQRSERFEALKRAAAAEPMNAETAYEIGEQLRVESWAGGDDYAERAAAAVTWFERAASLNPYDPSPRLRLGMCWVWVGQPDKAAPFFDRAGELDPNGYYTLAMRGWHQFHAGKLEQAKTLLQRSLELTPWGAPNPIASSYLALMERRASEPPSLLDRR
jgi:O-antigen ligase